MKRIAITAAATALALLVVSGCGAAQQSKDADPREVLGRFIDAVNSGDTDTAYDLISEKDRGLMSENDWKKVEGNLDTISEGEKIGYRFTDMDSGGNYAVIGVELELGGETGDTDIVLVKEDGSWKVSLSLTDAMDL